MLNDFSEIRKLLGYPGRMRELQIKYYKKHNAKHKERKRFKNRILVL